MRKENVLLGLVLSHLQSFSLEKFADRLLIQKKIYFAQKLGIDMGYHFGWYLRGPYCSALTSVAYDMIPEGDDFLNDYELNEEAVEVLAQVNELDSRPQKVQSGLSSEEWYELLASVDYLKNSSSWLEDKTTDGVFEKLRKEKPQFTREQFDLAWEVLQEVGLLARN